MVHSFFKIIFQWLQLFRKVYDFTYFKGHVVWQTTKANQLHNKVVTLRAQQGIDVKLAIKKTKKRWAYEHV
jgi:hypothetical protein